MSSIQTTARLTGVLILLLVVLAPFSMIYVPATLIVPAMPQLQPAILWRRSHFSVSV